eukprot:754866-Hanusia_phi.AAC.3
MRWRSGSGSVGEGENENPLFSFLDVVPCFEERSIKVPGWQIFKYRHRKHAYRFLQADFMRSLYRCEIDSLARPRHDAIKRLASSLERSILRTIRWGWKQRIRSKIGCFNEVLLEMLRELDLRKKLLSPTLAA